MTWSGDADVARQTFAPAAPGARPQLDYFVIRGPRFAQLLDRYTQLTGRPRFPRLGVFGRQLSDKNFPAVSDQSWWTSRITALRNEGFPLDVQVHDNRWRAGSGGLQLPPGRPDRRRRQRRRSGLEQSGDPRLGLGRVLGPLWIDEPDEMGPIPYDALAANGQRWSELRDAFFLYCQKGIGQEGWDPDAAGHIGRAKRPWTFTRGATAGQQRYGHLWTGDINSTYAEMREQIRGMLNAGMGGFPFANIDAGGFFGTVISDGLYRNWVAAWASMSPVWRPHSNGDTAAQGPAASRWPIDQGPANRADFLKYARVRYTLMPYLQYLWGPSIIVMPVTTDTGGAVPRVWLPAGDIWFNFWSDAQTVGSDTAEKSYVTSTGEIIMYVKAGSILPRYKYAQSTAFLDRTQLELEVYAGRDGSFTVYEDDGVTEEFRHSGASSTTVLTYTHAALRVVVSHPTGTYLPRRTQGPAVRRALSRPGIAGRDADQRRRRPARVHRRVGGRAQRQRPGLERGPEDPHGRDPDDRSRGGRRGRGDRRAQRHGLPGPVAPCRARGRGRGPQWRDHRLAARRLHRQRLRRLHQRRR